MDMWTFKTPWGVFGIVQKDGRFHAMFGSEHLGAYATPRQALDDLVNGHTLSLSNGLDSSEAGLPDDLSEWTYLRIGA